jgi:hypothetical protein
VTTRLKAANFLLGLNEPGLGGPGFLLPASIKSIIGEAVFIQEDLEYLKAQQARLERLYYLDGRDSKDHPHHSTYTGLHEKYLGFSRTSS